MIGQTNAGTDITLVKKSGDTMTGALIIKSPSFDLSANPPSSGNAYALPISWYDKNGVYLTSARPLRTAGDILAYRDGVQREVNGSTYYNFLLLGINASGTRSVTVSEAAPWRHAIGPAVNDVICTYNNTNPSANYEGTWTLLAKEFANYLNNSTSIPTGINATITSCLVMRSGTRVSLRVAFRPTVAIGESAVNLFSIPYSTLGYANGTGYQQYAMAYSDNGNGIIMLNAVNDNTNNVYTIQSQDVVTKTSGGSIAANSDCYLRMDFMHSNDTMLNSACNRFYWRRTA